MGSYMSEEKLPISEAFKPLESTTLYKTDKWWAAVVLLDSFGRRHVAFYLWAKSNDRWKRKQKFVVHNRDEWMQIKDVVEDYIQRLGA